MKPTSVVNALAALAHERRLFVFRRLVVAGVTGLTPSEMCNELGIAAPTLSFHLKALETAGLIHHEARGRHRMYRVDLVFASALVAFLTDQCCGGDPCALTGAQVQSPSACLVCSPPSCVSVPLESQPHVAA